MNRREPPPVYVEGFGAILPDGTPVPERAIAFAVECIAAACSLIEAAQAEAVAEAEAIVGGAG